MSTPSTPDPDDRTRDDEVTRESAPDEHTASGPTPPPPSWATSPAQQPSTGTSPGSAAPADPPPTPPAGAPDRAPALSTATGQHAAARPYPPSSPARPEDALTAPLAADGPPGPTAEPPARPSSGQTAVLPAAAGATAGATRDRRDLRDEDRHRGVHEDLPERPRKPGIGRHLLGTLLGLLLTPVALLLVGIGTARLDDVAGSGDPATDALGLTLLILGTLLVAVIVLLGAWSPAVPIVGGLVWGIGLGVAYLAVPDLMADTVESMVGERVLPAAVEQLTESAVSGQLLVTGTLLLAAGIAAARARRNGRRWAEAVAAADAARAEVARRDAERAAAG